MADFSFHKTVLTAIEYVECKCFFVILQPINLYFTPMGIFSFFSKEKKETLDKGLERTKQGVFSKIARAIAGKSKIDDEILDNLEEVFITSDVGVETTLKIIDRIEHRVSRDKYVNSSELNNLLCEEITELLAENNNDSALEDFTVPQDHKPHVIMVVGVNGVGKTTTIGKLAYQFKKAGNKVMLGGADTFRAAAVEQLDIWGERAGVPVIKQKLGADPASVAFDTLQSAKANDIDVVIIDTAGRLHNKKGLMDGLTKLKRCNWHQRPVPHSGKIHRTRRRHRRPAGVPQERICTIIIRQQLI